MRGAGTNVVRGLAGALVLVGFDYSKEWCVIVCLPSIRTRLRTRSWLVLLHRYLEYKARNGAAVVGA